MSTEHELPGEIEDTDSYDLTQVPEESGPLQRTTENGRNGNVQWKPSSRTVEETLAEGLSNEDLWMLIRRFNKQIYHVKALPGANQDLDLNRAENEVYPPEKLRTTLERFYTSVVVGLIEFFRHVGRLRSWKEPVRTAVFCGVYFCSWAADLLIPVTMSLLIALILCPPIRPFLFPSLPVQQLSESPNTNSSTSEQPESHDSLTGIPENHKGETAEQEAKVLLDSFATMAVQGAASKYGYTTREEEDNEADEPDTAETSTALAVTSPSNASPEAVAEKSAEEKTKKPMKSKVSQGTDKAMRVISDITDVYERFANILSPTPPFYLISPRLRISGILSIICITVPFTSSYWIIKLIGFILGFAFFGAPVFTLTTDLLNKKFPQWKTELEKQLDINMTLLKGVPTNAQLTLTLLRIGEINSSPLPPPPTTEEAESAWPIKRKKSKAATSPDLTNPALTNSPSSTSLDTENAPPKPKRRTIFKLLKFVRRTIATAIRGHIAFDRAMAIAGSAHTKNLLTMLQNHRVGSGTPYGPLKFDAKFERKRGAAVIDSAKSPPILYFTTYQSAGLEDLSIEARKKGSVLFQIPVTEIQELRKTEGLGWKGKLIVELTAGSKEAADGLVVVGKSDSGHGATGSASGQSFHLTGMRSRNQLFNRLVAIDAQFWESR